MKHKRAFLICLLTAAFLLQQAVCTSLMLGTMSHAGATAVGRIEALSLSLGTRDGVEAVSAVLLGYSWEGWRPATCMPDRCFCERIRDGAVRQPVNTWSNLAFILTSLLVIVIASCDQIRASRSGVSNPMRTQFIYPAVYGVVAILVGVGSTWYHMSLAFAGQVVDVISMYLLTGFMLLYNLSRMHRLSPKTFAVCYVLLNVVLGYLSIRWPASRRWIFLALVVAVIVSEVLVRRARRPRMNAAFLYAGFVSLGMACGAWILDITRAICSPTGWFQAHAMWHILMAALIGFIYLYYRSEDGCTRCDGFYRPSVRHLRS
jgi:hypothetical protein